MATPLRDALETAGLVIAKASPWKGHTKYVLQQCPFQTHSGPAKAAVIAFNTGGVTISCRTAKCHGKGWTDLCGLYPALAAFGSLDHVNAFPKVIRMDTIQPRPVDWLWPGRIARSKVSLWFGEPGAGKGMVGCAVTGSLTTGRALPDGPALPPLDVLYCSTEDAFEDTLQPRLVRAGADLTRVHAVEACFSLNPRGLKHLEEEIKKVTAGLVFIDPWAAYVGRDVDVHRANHTRPIFAELARIAGAQSCAIIVVHHPNKSDTQKASFRISGSIDMLGAVRTAYLFGASPATPDDRAMIPFKSNISGGVGALGYRIDKSSGDFSWTGPSKLTRENVLSGREDDILKDATEFLRAALAGGARPSNDVMEEMRANAFSGPTINRAKKAAGVKGTPVHGKGKKGVQKWMWML